MTITLHNVRKAKAWTATFQGFPDMPNGQTIPLPYTNQCSVFVIVTDMNNRFPQAAVYVR